MQTIKRPLNFSSLLFRIIWTCLRWDATCRSRRLTPRQYFPNGGNHLPMLGLLSDQELVTDERRHVIQGDPRRRLRQRIHLDKLPPPPCPPTCSSVPLSRVTAPPLFSYTRRISLSFGPTARATSSTLSTEPAPTFTPYFLLNLVKPHAVGSPTHALVKLIYSITTKHHTK